MTLITPALRGAWKDASIIAASRGLARSIEGRFRHKQAWLGAQIQTMNRKVLKLVNRKIVKPAKRFRDTHITGHSLKSKAPNTLSSEALHKILWPQATPLGAKRAARAERAQKYLEPR